MNVLRPRRGKAGIQAEEKPVEARSNKLGRGSLHKE